MRYSALGGLESAANQDGAEVVAVVVVERRGGRGRGQVGGQLVELVLDGGGGRHPAGAVGFLDHRPVGRPFLQPGGRAEPGRPAATTRTPVRRTALGLSGSLLDPPATA